MARESGQYRPVSKNPRRQSRTRCVDVNISEVRTSRQRRPSLAIVIRITELAKFGSPASRIRTTVAIPGEHAAHEQQRVNDQCRKARDRSRTRPEARFFSPYAKSTTQNNHCDEGRSKKAAPYISNRRKGPRRSGQTPFHVRL